MAVDMQTVSARVTKDLALEWKAYCAKHKLSNAHVFGAVMRGIIDGEIELVLQEPKLTILKNITIDTTDGRAEKSFDNFKGKAPNSGKIKKTIRQK